MSQFKIYLVSKSGVKLRAAEAHFETKEITQLEAGPTSWNQPLGTRAGLHCALERVAPHRELIAKSGERDLFVVIESYISYTYETSMSDKSGVLLITNSGLSTHWFDGVGVAYTTKALLMARQLWLTTPCDDLPTGTDQTLGKLFAASVRGDCAHDDWFEQAGMTMTRAAQIEKSLGQACRTFTAARDIELEPFQDFPKAPCVFEDMFSIFADVEQQHRLVERMRAVHDVCVGLQSVAGNTQKLAVVGIESRGLALGLLMAGITATQFVPMRKAGKLPHDAERPLIKSDKYSTEYSTDTIELRPTLFGQGARGIILVDDVVATGGSLCAAIELLVQAGHTVAHVVVLRDIKPLRAKWQAKLKALSPHTHVHFLI